MWTDEQVRYLRANFRKKTAKEIGYHIGKSVDSVAYMAHRIGISKKREKWTADEREFIKQHCFEMTIAQLADKLNKTPKAVANKLVTLRQVAQNHSPEESIEHGILISSTKAAEYRDILGRLEIGDSFVYPQSERATVNNQRAVHSKRQFHSKRIDEKTRRIWRIK